MAGLKLLKSDEEIAEVRRTVAIGDAGFRAAQRAIRPGATDAEVGAAIRAEIFAQGAREALTSSAPSRTSSAGRTDASSATAT